VKNREVPNIVWKIFIPISLAFTASELIITNFENLYLNIISIAFSTVFALGIFYLGLFGGADAKALISLSIAMPLPPKTFNFPVGSVLPFFPLSVFSNAILLCLLIIPITLISNILFKYKTKTSLFQGLESETLLKKAGALIFCAKVKASEVNSYDAIAEEFYREPSGKIARKLVIFRRTAECENTELAKKDNLPEYVFIHFALPLLVFITVGFILTLFFGDVLFTLITTLMPR
jgi:preflagellin peptidase FlaK